MEKEMLLYNPWCKYKMASKKHPTQNQDQWYKEKKKTTLRKSDTKQTVGQ